jgi:hypothetical protein
LGFSSGLNEYKVPAQQKAVAAGSNKNHATIPKSMKQTIAVLTIIVCLTGCTNSQTNTSQLTGDIGTDIKNLIRNGDHMVDIMDGVKQNPRQAALTVKFQGGIKKNYEWFIEYIKTVPAGEPMPFHSKLGMTKTEYDELMGYLNDIELVSTGKENIKVELNNDTIYFKAKGKLSDYNSLKIDLKSNVVILGQFKMVFADTSNVTDDKNGLRSKWKGYTWRFEEPNDLNLDDLKELGNLKMKQYKFTLGRLDKNGKTYMSLKGREIEDGVKIVDFELPVIF